MQGCRDWTPSSLVDPDVFAAAEDALEFAARALRQVSIGSQDWARLLGEQKAYAMGKHGTPLRMHKKCATSPSAANPVADDPSLSTWRVRNLTLPPLRLVQP